MIRRELGLFLAVGALTVIIDYLIYSALSWRQSFPLGVAKGIGFIAGTIFAYFANRFFTFGHSPNSNSSALRFSLLYAVSLSANVAVNDLALVVLSPVPRAIDYAFLIATTVSATLNFVGMKLFVFSTTPLTRNR
jgi:putative flippase GtrA